jgi:GNAT superfamily N-acetyltransferase
MRTREDAMAEIERVTDPVKEGVFFLLDLYLREIGEPDTGPAARARIAAAAAGDRIRFYAARRDREPIGLCSLTFAFSTFAGGAPVGWLEDVYVLPAHRGRGVARALLDRVFDEAGTEGCSSVVVGCADHDVPMYRALGFTARLGTLLSRVLVRG